VFVEGFGRCLPSEDLSQSRVECSGDRLDLFGVPARQVGAFGKELPQETVRVLAGAALPGTVRIGKEDGDAGLDLERGAPRAPCHGPRSRSGAVVRATSSWPTRTRSSSALPVAAERWTVLCSGDDAVAVLAGQVDQHREPGGSLDEAADR
jgi:hypothetical protein